MTTLVIRDNLIMGDGGIFHDTGYSQLGTAKKVFKLNLHDGNFIYWAGCGDGGTESILARFLSDTWRSQDLTQYLDKVMPTGVDYGIIACLPNRQVWTACSENHGMIDIFDADYYAMGAGDTVALGALSAGADAIGAIQATIKHNLFTKWPIQGFNVSTGEELIFNDAREVSRWRLKNATT